MSFPFSFLTHLEYPQCHTRFDVSTLKEPYRIEGKKTMGYELAEQYTLAEHLMCKRVC